MKTPPGTILRTAFAICAVAICCSGCGTAPKMSADRLASMGVVEGAAYWQAQQKLAQEGYQCSVSGAKREHFDCAKTQGFLITCVLRVDFEVDDQNRISRPSVPEPACIGTP
jgi:hypothetical protein